MRRLLFKLASAIHVFVYRLTGGKIGGEMRGFRLLLLTTTGRKTGKTRTIPLGYFEHDGDYGPAPPSRYRMGRLKCVRRLPEEMSAVGSGRGSWKWPRDTPITRSRPTARFPW